VVNPLLADIRTGTTGVVATPLTVETRFPLVAVNVLLLIIVTSAPVTPLTVVFSVFTEELFETDVLVVVGSCITNFPLVSKPNVLVIVPAVGLNVTATPFTVLVIPFPDAAVKALLPIIVASVVASTPFIVVLTVFTVGFETSVLPTIVASVVAATPFIVVRTVFIVGLDTVLLLIIVTSAPVTPLTVVFSVLAKELFETDVLVAVGSCITNLPLVSKPNVLVIVPVVGLNVTATPFTVLVIPFPVADVKALVCATVFKMPVASAKTILSVVAPV